MGCASPPTPTASSSRAWRRRRASARCRRRPSPPAPPRRPPPPPRPAPPAARPRGPRRGQLARHLHRALRDLSLLAVARLANPGRLRPGLSRTDLSFHAQLSAGGRAGAAGAERARAANLLSAHARPRGGPPVVGQLGAAAALPRSVARRKPGRLLRPALSRAAAPRRRPRGPGAPPPPP